MLNNAFVNVLSLPTMILNYNFRDMQVAFIISLCVTNRLYTIENLANVFDETAASILAERCFLLKISTFSLIPTHARKGGSPRNMFHCFCDDYI